MLRLGLGLALRLQLGIGIGFRRNHSWSSTFTPRRNHSLCLISKHYVSRFFLPIYDISNSYVGLKQIYEYRYLYNAVKKSGYVIYQWPSCYVRNPGVSWAFLFLLITQFTAAHKTPGVQKKCAKFFGPPCILTVLATSSGGGKLSD